jgi:hypothetical protein
MLTNSDADAFNRNDLREGVSGFGVDSSVRRLAYGKHWKTVAIVLAFAAVCLATFVAIAEDRNRLLGFALTVTFFGAMLGPLFIEFWGVTIEWDDENIYARSPWRKPRKIPMAAVTSCDFSIWLQWYRIHTNGLGTIRMHKYMSGIASLLNALPCTTPRWPPPITLQGAANTPMDRSGGSAAS